MKPCQILGHLFQLLLFSLLLQVEQFHFGFETPALFPQLLVLPTLLLELVVVSGLQVSVYGPLWTEGRDEEAHELNFVEGLVEPS